MRMFPSVEVVRRVLHGMPRGKASRSDGMTVENLAHHWVVIKNGFFTTVIHFFKNRRMLAPMNHTFLVLISKKDSPTTLDDYWPISCLGVSYKIISKLLANRIATILPNIILASQKAEEFSYCIYKLGSSIQTWFQLPKHFKESMYHN